MPQEYRVHLTSTPVAALNDALVESFAEALDRERGIAGAVPAANLVTRTLSLTASVDAKSPEEALDRAGHAFERSLKLAGFEIVDIAEVEIEAANGAGDRRELVSGAEVARRVGMSRERVRQLAGSAGRFPPSVAKIGTYRIWKWGDIVDWAEIRGRKVGDKKVASRTRRPVNRARP